MKAIFIVRTGLPQNALRVRECPEPEPGPGQVRIAVRAFGINFADVLARTGMYLDAPPLPFIPGYEVAGVVEAVGPVFDKEVPSAWPSSDLAPQEPLEPGDRVAALTDFGGYAQKAVAPRILTVRIPDGMDWAEAASIPVNGVTAWLALCGMTRVQEGDRVLIHAAAGGVGTIAVQIALDAGCEVFGTVGSEEKAKFLRETGVHHPIVHTRQDVEAEVKRITGGGGLDLVLDSLGGRSIASGMRMLAPSGRLVSIGIASLTPRKSRSLISAGMGLLKVPFLHPYSMLSDSRSFIGINLKRLGPSRPRLLARALREAFRLVREGRVRPRLDSVYFFEDCAAAHERLHSRQSIGKVVVTVPCETSNHKTFEDGAPTSP